MGPFGSSIKVETFVPEGVPIILGSHLHATRLVEESFKYVTEEHAERLQNSNVYKGDVVFTHRGTIGQCSYIPEKSKYPRYIVSQSQFYMRCDATQVLPEYVAYYFGSHAGQHQLLANSSQIGVPAIARPSTYLRELSIPMPPIAEQRKITRHLGALDDKIELNHRMSATLEAMARALFQSWFVNFDPVRAKGEGRQPVGMDAETAALFPDSFEDSALGPIPKGWSVGTMGNVTRTRNEKVGTASAQVLSAVTTGKLIRSGEYFKKQVFSASIHKYLVVRQWDFAYNPSRVNIGSIGLLEEDVMGAVSPVYEVVTPQSSFHWFIEKSLRLPFVQDQIRGLCSGSVRQTLKPNDFASIQLVLPPAEVVHAYNASWARQWSKIISLSIENRVLTQVRDTILPKLLSGELRVGDVAA